MKVSLTTGPSGVGSSVCWTITGAQGKPEVTATGTAQVTGLSVVKGGSSGEWVVCLTMTSSGFVELNASDGKTSSVGATKI
jgi:hypothetical protein